MFLPFDPKTGQFRVTPWTVFHGRVDQSPDRVPALHEWERWFVLWAFSIPGSFVGKQGDLQGECKIGEATHTDFVCAVHLFLFSLVKRVATKQQKPTFQVGDWVRLSKKQKVFDKSCLSLWTKEVFFISQVIPGVVNTYKVTEWNGTSTEGTFYKQELQKLDVDDQIFWGANFTIVKTQLVHGISIWNKSCIEAHPLLFLVLKYFWWHSKRAPSRDQNLKGILTPAERVLQESFDTWKINSLSQT